MFFGQPIFASHVFHSIRGNGRELGGDERGFMLQGKLGSFRPENHALLTYFCYLGFRGRKKSSWLNKMPVQANRPCFSEKLQPEKPRPDRKHRIIRTIFIQN
jgi:hypothetical protein